MSRKKNMDIGVRTSKITLILNSILMLIKFFAGIFSGSSAMIADAAHTLSDVGTTVAVIIALRIGAKEADAEHQYGHDRYEFIISSILGIVLIVTGIGIGFQALKYIISGDINIPTNLAWIAALISIIIKEIMYQYTIRTAKLIDSLAMKADAWHHRSDALSSIGVFLGIIGAKLGFPILDPIAGLIVAVLVIKVGVDIYRNAVYGLVDKAADKKKTEKIKSIVMENKDVKKISKLLTRRFANEYYIDLSIEVDGNLTVDEGHDIAHEVHDDLEDRMEIIRHVMIHVEPHKKS